MKEFETLHLIKGEDLNHHGTLFAARAAAWFVEAAFAAAALEHGNSKEIVCRNMHDMSFHRPMEKGSIALFKSRVVYIGKTSLIVYVKVLDAVSKVKAVDGYVTFVTVEEMSGKKLIHNMTLDEAQGEEREIREAALHIVGKRRMTAQPGEQETAQPGEQETAQPGEQETAQPGEQEALQPEVQVASQPEADTAAQTAVNTDTGGLLQEVECFALDMDGTIYLGERWIEGAQDFLQAIEDAGREYVFLTNNSSKSPEVYVQKLKRMGLHVDGDKIITSGQATIYYLKKHFPGKRVFLLGNAMLREEFAGEGICFDEETPEVVVTAFDTSLDYGKMCKVCDFVRAGLPYIATHPDYNCPTEEGFIPDAGAIHAFIHASAERYPDRIIGKPNGDIVDYLIARTGKERDKIAMVGDRLYTDIAAGKNNGLKSILVLSGEASLKDVESSEVKPDLIFDSVKEMPDFL